MRLHTHEVKQRKIDRAKKPSVFDQQATVPSIMMTKKKGDLLQGTLDMLILKTLTLGSMHGYAIVRRIQQVSDKVLAIEEGSLYPALHRMEKRKWIDSEWGMSENNRKAKYYSLTHRGQKQLEEEISIWERLSGATSKVLTLTPDAQ